MAIIIRTPNPYGTLSKNELEHFEEMFNVSLPDDYRDFLLKNNGGQPTPSFFWIQPNIDGSSVLHFFGLNDGPKHLSLLTYFGELRSNFPFTLLPICDDGLGNFLCLGISSNNHGEVFFLDHDVYPFNNQDSNKGIIKIANSFSEFLDSLEEDPE